MRLTMLPIVTCGWILWAQGINFPTIDRLASGELLSGGDRDLLPQGVKLRRIHPDGIKLTKQFEGWVPTLYNDSAKYCTIGYGHLVKRAPCDGTERPMFARGLTEPQGSDLLIRDMATSQYAVMKSVTVSLTDGQFAALTDFTFNVGSQNFRTSKLLKLVNASEMDRIPWQFRRWVLAGGKPWPGLKRRRELEIAVFFTGLPKPRGLPQPGEDLSPIDMQKDD